MRSLGATRNEATSRREIYANYVNSPDQLSFSYFFSPFCSFLHPRRTVIVHHCTPLFFIVEITRNLTGVPLIRKLWLARGIIWTRWSLSSDWRVLQQGVEWMTRKNRCNTARFRAEPLHVHVETLDDQSSRTPFTDWDKDQGKIIKACFFGQLAPLHTNFDRSIRISCKLYLYVASIRIDWLVNSV